MKWFYDKGKGILIDYKEGEMVWLYAQNLRRIDQVRNLIKETGPFKILEKSDVGISIAIPKSWNRIDSVFNEVLLSPSSTTIIHLNPYPNLLGP